jgi:hypothetical protein
VYKRQIYDPALEVVYESVDPSPLSTDAPSYNHSYSNSKSFILAELGMVPETEPFNVVDVVYSKVPEGSISASGKSYGYI